jgi:hypothetical protein
VLELKCRGIVKRLVSKSEAKVGYRLIKPVEDHRVNLSDDPVDGPVIRLDSRALSESRLSHFHTVVDFPSKNSSFDDCCCGQNLSYRYRPKSGDHKVPPKL